MFYHDCDSCVYLGSKQIYYYALDKMRDYDLYICQDGPTLLARFGNDSPDYMSRRAKHLDANYPELMTAAILALKQGLISTDDLENF